MVKNNTKNLSPEAKRMLQQQRRKMAREQARTSSRIDDDARNELRRLRNLENERPILVATRATLKGVAELATAVVRSFGVGVPMKFSLNWTKTSPEAWTDFKQITVKYPMAPMFGQAPQPTVSWGSNDGVAPTGLTLSDLKPDQFLLGLSATKALMYHEMGHILFTVSWTDLQKLVFGQDTDLSVIIQRGTLVFGPHYPDWGKFHFGHPLHDVHAVRALHRAHNMLEDQRMETALVEESPVLAKYFARLAIGWMLNASVVPDMSAQYLLVAGRRFLPRAVRTTSRSEFVARFGETLTLEAEAIIASYCEATDPEVMMIATMQMVDLLAKLGVNAPGTGRVNPSPGDGDGDGGTVNVGASTPRNHADKRSADEHDKVQDKLNKSANKKPSEDKPSEDKPSEDKPSEQDGAGDSAGDSESPTDTDDGNSNSNTDGNTDGNSDSDLSSAGDGERSDSLSDLLQELADEMDSEIARDGETSDIVSSIFSDISSGHIPMEPECRVTAMSPEVEARAMEVADRLRNAFDSATSACQPVWEDGHRQGVINAFRYRTRRPGDQEYRRMLNGDGNTGFDIAVTLLLDTSGSMSNEGVSLGVSAYAIKSACQQNGISCRVITFDSCTRELWGQDDEPTLVALQPDGGTHPSEALQACVSDQGERLYHVVVVLTDGEWTIRRGEDCTIDDVRGHNRFFLGVGYGVSVDHLRQHNFDEAVSINSIEALPEVIKEFVLKFLG